MGRVGSGRGVAGRSPVSSLQSPVLGALRAGWSGSCWPSVWVAGEYIGGLNDGPGLLPLDEQGELEPKLRAAGAL